jgi:hypothetical protein
MQPGEPQYYFTAALAMGAEVSLRLRPLVSGAR